MSEEELTPGRATPEGTQRFADRFPDLPGHFRRPDRLHVSSLGLGTRNGEPEGVDALLYRSAVPQLLQGGVNLFDTALSDRMQESERNLGVALQRAFAEGDASRDEVFVASKGGYLTIDGRLVADRSSARRYLVETYLHSGLVDPDDISGGVHCMAPAFLRDQIERSRANLRLETVDCYLIEEPEVALASSGPDALKARVCAAFECLESAVSDGLIGCYGLCTWDGLLTPHTDRSHLSLLDLFEWALDVGGADHHLRALQLPYSLAMAEALKLPSQLGPDGGTDAILSSLRGTGTAVFASTPLVQGRALGHLPDVVIQSFPDLQSDAQRSLQFVRSTPGITSAVVGMRDPDHIDENLALASYPPADPEQIEALFKPAAGV
jgi:aryl-alcohol dehydrogenase-like predicted oxidoreductase